MVKGRATAHINQGDALIMTEMLLNTKEVCFMLCLFRINFDYESTCHDTKLDIDLDSF